MELEFAVLGALEVRAGGASVTLTSAKQRQVLAVLLAQRQQVVSADALATALWADRPPANAKGVIQNHVSRLRKELNAAIAGGGSVLETVAAGYRLATDDVDAVQFERLSAAGHAHLEAHRFGEARAALEDALALWRGRPFADVVDTEVVWLEAQRLQACHDVAVEDRIDAALEEGRHRELVSELERLVAEHPLRERLWMQLMRALYASGRQSDALRACAQLRRLLAEELGLDVSPEVAELEGDILQTTPPCGRPRHGVPGTARRDVRSRHSASRSSSPRSSAGWMTWPRWATCWPGPGWSR